METEIVVVGAPKRKRDYVGRRVRLLRKVENYQVAVPAGALGTVTHQSPLRPNSNGWRNGSCVKFDACGCCGVAAVMRGLGPDDFEFIDERHPAKRTADSTQGEPK